MADGLQGGTQSTNATASAADGAADQQAQKAMGEMFQGLLKQIMSIADSEGKQ